MSENNWRESLFYEQKNGYDLIDAEETKLVYAYCEGYKRFMDAARTEREAVKTGIELAEEEGFVPFVPGMALKAGDKVYFNNRGKSLILAVIGKKPLSEGCVIAGAHVDSPRLDLKQLPLFEDTEMAYFKTHYYGGIKKYQWVTIPLELHGVVALKNGEVIDVVIGRDPEDPQFVITDLLPHLAADQMKKTMAEGVKAEALNILIGSVPYADEGKDRVKLAVLSLLHDDYGITEEDFLSAELTAVPAFQSRDIGFDRSFIGAYGHDDRVCAYAELRAILDLDVPERTAVCILADKEEIGSEGVSGMQSQAFDTFMADLCETQGVALRRCFENSPPTCATRLTLTTLRSARSATRPRSTTAWASANIPARAASPARVTPPPRSWRTCAACSRTRASCGSCASSARSIRAAAARSQSSWPTATSTRSTPVCRS